MFTEKRGDFVVKNLMSLLLGAAAVLVLMLLFFNIFYPVFREAESVAESIEIDLSDALEDLKTSDYGELDVVFPPGDNMKYFLVYFNDNKLIKGWEYSKFYNDYRQYNLVVIDFFLGRIPDNTVCFCYSNMDETALVEGGISGSDPLGAHSKTSSVTDVSCNKCWDFDSPVVFKPGVTYAMRSSGKYRDFSGNVEKLNSDLESDPVIRLGYSGFKIVIKKAVVNGVESIIFDEVKK